MLKKLLFCLVPFLVFGVYLRALDAPFAWDDRHLIEFQQEGAGAALDFQVFLRPFWVEQVGERSGVYYRPLVSLSFGLDALLHGQNPAGYHLTNLLFHVLNAWLFYLLLRRSAVRGGLAVGVALLWALLPRLSEAVAWISGRTDVLALSFVLTALWLHKPGSVKSAGLSALWILCGLLCKEVAIAGFFAILADEYRVKKNGVWHPFLLNLFPFGVALVLYMVLRLYALGSMPALETVALSGGERALVILEALGRYSFDLLVPWLPRLQQGELGRPTLAFVALGVVVLLVAIVLGGKALTRRREEGAAREGSSLQWGGLSLAAVSFLLVLHLIPLPSRGVAADRFLYFPSLGLLWACAPWINKHWDQARWVRWVGGGLLLSFAVATWLRVEDWTSELRLWKITAAQVPTSNGLPLNELGNVYSRAGLLPEAHTIFRAGFSRLEADGAMARSLANNLAHTAAQLGQLEEARALLEQLCSIETPGDCLKLVRLDLRELRLGEAQLRLQELSQRAPSLSGLDVAQAQLTQVQVASDDPALHSANPIEAIEARFRLEFAAGRHLEILELGARILGDTRFSREVRREALEYWVRFGPPQQLQVVDSTELTDEVLLSVANIRIEDSLPLLAAWPELKAMIQAGTAPLR